MKIRFHALIVVISVAGFGCSSSSSSGPADQPPAATADPLCAGVTGNCVSFKAGTSETAIGTAFNDAKKGDTLVFDAGTFTFTNQLGLTADGVTVKGQGADKTTLDFSGQMAGGEAISVMANDFTFEDLAVQDSPGNGIKIEGGTGVTLRRLKVSWTGTDASKHGPYGLYPVQCTNVLVEDSDVQGASDAGVYVGQSTNVVVQRNHAAQNVAGIEIENCHGADVHDNVAEDNTGGILVFALPGLMVPDCHTVRVYSNTIRHNNTANFAAAGDIVSMVPKGTGFFAMAADEVEVFGNTIQDNGTVNAGVISYLITMIKYDMTQYYPYPKHVWIHDNTFSGGGDMIDTKNEIGGFLAGQSWPGNRLPDILYDGIVDPMVTDGPNATNNMTICESGNGAATWANIHADKFDIAKGFPADFDAGPYTCSIPALSPITFPGLD